MHSGINKHNSYQANQSIRGSKSSDKESKNATSIDMINSVIIVDGVYVQVCGEFDLSCVSSNDDLQISLVHYQTHPPTH